MKPYQALIWNEWRQMRGNVIALAGVTVLSGLLLLLGCFYKIQTEYIGTAATALAVGLPLLYSVVLADSFTREFIQNTDRFLLEMPVSSTKIFFCKYFANLTIFLVLATITTLTISLIIYAICPKAGKDFIPISILLIVMSSWISVHGTIFAASLLGGNTGNGVLAITIMPLLYLLLFPVTMAIAMFFINNNSVWLISGLWLTLIVLYLSCIGFGWYLWSVRIVRGRKIVKPIIAASFIILLAPFILFWFSYFYTIQSFHTAIQEAKASGLETDRSKQYPPPVPAEQNAATKIPAFNNEYTNLSGKESPGPMPSQCTTGLSWTGTDFNFQGKKRDVLSQQIIIAAADFILNDPHINQCYVILAETLKKSHCRFWRGARVQYSTAAVFLSDRAYALRVTGRDNDFFVCIAGIDKIANALTEWPYADTKESGLELKEMEYQTAIAAGPETHGAMKFYHEMIKSVDSINPAMPPDILYSLDGLKDINISKCLNPESPTDMNQWWMPLMLPRLFQMAGAQFRWEIQRYKLLKQASASDCIQAIEPEVNLLEKKLTGIPGNLGIKSSGIKDFFMWRSKFESYKLCLALKIYHIKYGKFPDSLQQLVPEILPKIPVCPDTGKDYIYQPEANGFNLSGYENLAGIRYQTWDIKPEQAK